jgi:hypothetical protein
MPRSPKKKTESDGDTKPDVKPYAKSTSASGSSPKKASRAWTKEEKEVILLSVIESAQVDWNAIASRLEGRTAMQVSIASIELLRLRASSRILITLSDASGFHQAKDQWRQVLLPAIKKNDAIFGVRGG